MTAYVKHMKSAGLGLSVLALTACTDGFDLDVRGVFDGMDTSAAAQGAVVTSAPAPDGNGVIQYPNYRMAIAQGGDTISTLSARVGADASAVASLNGLQPDSVLREGEMIALPDAGFNAGVAGPLQNDVSVTELSPIMTDVTPNAAPIRHKVEPGETAFSISRLYDIPVSALQELNGLNSDLTVREGQILLIPTRTATNAAEVSAPGAGSLTPIPPSSTTPQPLGTPGAAAANTSPNAPLGTTTAASASTAAMQKPVPGDIIRAYQKGRNDGIDIGAPAGTTVKAADGGRVAAISKDTNGINLLVIQHADNVLTVYTNIDGITVQKGDSVRRGQSIAKIAPGSPSFLHFEVRRGLESVDPEDYI
ncbi:MAG: peptidoglycan DD-metalloendopeptidase family protein [Planktomarina sp.]